MLAKILSASVLGIDAHGVEVEVDITSRGLPHFSMVGLPDAAVKESRDRVRAALKNIGFNFPLKQITVNLAPADLKKEGSSFDLPIAVGIIAAEGVIDSSLLDGYLFTGELSLDGRIKPVRGAMSTAILARTMGLKGLILPAENAPEAAVVGGVRVFGMESLPAILEFLVAQDSRRPFEIEVAKALEENSLYEDDFSDVKGQEHAKRALEVSAAGGHNVLMIGPPGSGKTMLSKRLPSILPAMTFDEDFETARIHIEVPAVPYKELSTEYAGEKSETIRERVIRARSLQLERFKGDRIYSNGQMKTRHIKKHCALHSDAQTLLETAMHKLGLSARAYARILKLSRTIADLEASALINSHHVSEAIQYRTLDRGIF